MRGCRSSTSVAYAARTSATRFGPKADLSVTTPRWSASTLPLHSLVECNGFNSESKYVSRRVYVLEVRNDCRPYIFRATRPQL
jgi:hypothetical protein